MELKVIPTRLELTKGNPEVKHSPQGNNGSDNERVRIFQRKLYMKAKQEKGFKFYVLYDKVRLDYFLRESYRRVKQNGGAPGVDGITFEQIEAIGVENYLEEIREELATHTYKPSMVKRVYIAKANGKMRPLGIPTIKDRIVQMSCKMVIEPIFEADFEDSSYGFRPKRSSKDAIIAIKKHLQAGRTTVLDADIRSYFDNIPHEKLMIVIKERISDKNIIKLIKMWLKSPVKEGNKITGGKRSKLGTPQGGVISPLLANIYLNLVDRIINKMQGEFRKLGIYIVRYADDFVIMGRKITDKVITRIENIFGRMELELNKEKTRIKQATEESFDFLGFTFRYDRSLYNTGQKYWNIIPSKKSEKKLRELIREYLWGRRHLRIAEVVAGLNVRVRGWLNYYKIPKASNIKRTTFKLQHYLGRRLKKYFEKKSQRGCKRYSWDAHEKLVKHWGLINVTKFAYD
jgi:group II intron reverse transcriptase/maturase